MGKRLFILFVASLLAFAGLGLAHAPEAKADTSKTGFDLLLGIGMQFCTDDDDKCNTSESLSAVGGLSAGYTFELHPMFAIGPFFDLDMGGLDGKGVDRSFTMQANLMLKAFVRPTYFDFWLGLGVGFAHYQQTVEVLNSEVTAKWNGGSLKVSIGATYFLPMMSNIGVGIDYAYIHNYSGKESGDWDGYTIESNKKVDYIGISQFKFHVRLNF
ncbi:MAG: outer membrane beta-barrel protein [Bradymonadia bacterium]|jgi:hypothetical protein